MEKDNIFLRRRRKTEKEEEENIWIWVFFLGEKKNCKGKGGKYLEKENIWYTVDKKNGEGKSVRESKSRCVTDRHTHRRNCEDGARIFYLEFAIK